MVSVTIAQMQRNCNAVRKPSFPPCGIAPQTPTYPVPLSAGYKIVKLASGVHSVHSPAERETFHPVISKNFLIKCRQSAPKSPNPKLRNLNPACFGVLSTEARSAGSSQNLNWRRERDSNPRKDCSFTGLANLRFRPLSHLSRPHY